MNVAFASLAAVVALAGCPKERTGAGGGTATPPVDAAPVFQPAAVAIVSDAVVPAKLDWARPVLTEDELEDALRDVEAARRQLGAFVVRVKGGRLGPYDAKSGTLLYVGPGLGGIQADPPVSFVAAPDLTVGEMPLGGHVTLHVGELQGTIALDAAAAQALRAAAEQDPFVMELRVALEGETVVDGARVVKASLEGVRVVREGAREVLLEGTVKK